MIDLITYGFDNYFEMQITKDDLSEGLIPARVISIQKETYRVVSSLCEKDAKLKGSYFYQDSEYNTYPAVGDFVLVKPNEYGDDIIHNVLDRKTSFQRTNPSYRNASTMLGNQVVATNFDYVFIMMSLNQDFNIRKLERYVITGFTSGATPVILLTKADLCLEFEPYIEQINELIPGVDVLAISSHTGYGLLDLSKYLAPRKTVVFLGSSGIGKSSLVNVLASNDLMKVNDIRESDSRGHHTTTHRHLFLLENGVNIIDTPGMRELELWDVGDSLGDTFADINELKEQCRFKDCKHENEPDCAIKNAMASGTLDASRYKSYQKLLKEAKRGERKASFLKVKTNANKNKSKYEQSSKIK
jgi:ribosome biogenesis GTPase